MNNQLPQVLTVEQFAGNFGVGRTVAYAEMKAGRLRMMKFGRNTRIALVDAMAWLEARRTGGEGGPHKQAA